MNPKEIINKRLDYLGRWRIGYKLASNIAPYIDQMYEYTKWEHEVLNTTSSTVADDIFKPLTSYYNENYMVLQSILPQLPNYDESAIMAVTPTSTGIATYDILTANINNTSAAVSSWALKHTKSYEELQNKDITKNKIRERLCLLDLEIVEEFDLAEIKITTFKMDIENQQSVGILLRNVLERYKGKLFKKALKPPKQKIKNLSEFVESLSIEQKGSHSFNQLLLEGKVWDELHTLLTNIAKLNTIITYNELKFLHTKYINHLYSVLLLIKLQ